MGSPSTEPHSSASHSDEVTNRPFASRSIIPDREEVEREVDLSVIIVNYNVREFLEQALRSVERAGRNLDVEVIVVDNSSVDGSVTMVRSEFPEVRIIANETNVGFSRANNQAIREARGRFLLILNPDTIVQEDTFEALIDFMEAHPRAGAVGCKILHPDGTFARESRRAFPTPEVAFYRLVGLANLFPSSRRFGRYNLTYLSEDDVAEVDALSGSCMMVRRKAIYDSPERCGAGAGLLDENFFMYGEDLDWCYRIQQAGWKIYYTPETQIIHYKGESTKKGELRYVRLFYGAMMQFAEKHFEYRYSRIFASLLRAGIVFRASMSVLGKWTRSLAWPAIDFVLVFLTASATAMVHSASLEASPAPLFFAVVAPAYGLGTVAGIASCSGYGWRRRLRCVWFGVFVGLLVVSALSFFAKDVAFSRMVVLLTFPTSALLLSAARLMWESRIRRNPFSKKAVLVGRLDEAVRLRQMLARHPSPPFTLSGYVAATEMPPNGRAAHDRDVELLGSIHQLRDVVRLGNIHDVIFAPAALSNRTIFRLIQQLRDLPVHFRILAEGRDHVIGKASVDDLSMTNLVEAEEALVHTRSRAGERTFDLVVATAGVLAHPLLAVAAAVAGSESFARRLLERTRRMPHVFRGSYSIVGFDPRSAYRPPVEWGLRPGVFAVSDVLNYDKVGSDDIGAAYWFYVRNQSGSLDWDIVVRSLRVLRRQECGPRKDVGERSLAADGAPRSTTTLDGGDATHVADGIREEGDHPGHLAP